jgi:predicted MPP superfamily phosphohydrolase
MPFRILHISDMHFGRKCCELAGDFETAALIVYRQLVDSLGEAPAINSIVFSGDFAWDGTSEEFAAAELFARTLSADLGVPLSDCVFVPGNHDVKWYSGASGIGGDIPNTRKKAFAPYRRFLRQLKGDRSNRFLADVVSFTRDRIVILGLNSSRFEGKQNSGLGYIGRSQIESIMYDLQQEGMADFLKIAVTHHHVLPVADLEVDQLVVGRDKRRFSLTIDAADVVSTLLVYDVSALLHGHMHVPFCAVERRPATAYNHLKPSPECELIVTAAGSLSVAKEYCYAWHYQIISVEDDSIEIREALREHNKPAWRPARKFSIPLRRSYSVPEITPAELNFRLDSDEVLASWIDAVQVINGVREAYAQCRLDAVGRPFGALERLNERERGSIFDDVISSIKGDELKSFKENVRDPQNGVTFLQYVLLLMERLASKRS